MLVTNIFSFSYNVLKASLSGSSILMNVWLSVNYFKFLNICRQKAFEIIVGKGGNTGSPFPIKFFYSVKDRIDDFCDIHVCWCFQFGQVSNLLFCKRLILSQRTNFRLFQTDSVCRQQFWIWRKWQKVLKMDWKHCGKRRNCSLWAISPFPTGFSEDL